MGYIDADTHLYETDATWSYLAEDEQRYRPVTVVTVTDDPSKAFRRWLVQDQRPLRSEGDDRGRKAKLFPKGTRELTDVPARLACMDGLGVDLQVIFPTFWLVTYLTNPLAEQALARSYNRWLAESVDGSGSRLRWVLRPPVMTMDSALAELEFGAAHGAVGALLHGLEHGMSLSDPYFFPLYERAEALGLTIAVHISSDSRQMATFFTPATGFFLGMTECLQAFYSLLMSDIPERFPSLKFGFYEAGSGWVPWVVQEGTRSAGTSTERNQEEVRWQERARTVLAEKNFYVACMADDDIGYLTEVLGSDNFVLGTDWGHDDAASDVAAHRMVDERADLPEDVRRKIVDINARRLFNIAADFCPANLVAAGRR